MFAASELKNGDGQASVFLRGEFGNCIGAGLPAARRELTVSREFLKRKQSLIFTSSG